MFLIKYHLYRLRESNGLVAEHVGKVPISQVIYSSWLTVTDRLELSQRSFRGLRIWQIAMILPMYFIIQKQNHVEVADNRALFTKFFAHYLILIFLLWVSEIDIEYYVTIDSIFYVWDQIHIGYLVTIRDIALLLPTVTFS